MATANRAEPAMAASDVKRVVVAMSGGVDSSVAAAMMKAAGHDVIGITLQLYDHGSATGRKGSCCAGQDIHDARRVAEQLGIPHYVLDYENRFTTKVIEQFAESYIAGETPIPCVTCNNEIKFSDLLKTALDLNADYLVTGHYVQRIETAAGPRLARAVDADRDQSYFLFGVSRDQLQRLWFPLGNMPKAAVRDLAHTFNLPVADKADSQDICFVPTGRYTDVIAKLHPEALEDGDIVHIDGRVLGRHNGIINYTVGQRRGLKIPAQEPLFVVRLEPARNRVVVGPRAALQTTGLILRAVNWLGDEPIEAAASDGLELFVRLRSSHAPRPAVLMARPGEPVTVELVDGEAGVSTGQACVFYSSDSDQAEILGGGYIAQTIKPDGIEAVTAPMRVPSGAKTGVGHVTKAGP